MISVCIATYNGGRYVEEQLRSVLCQLGPDDEIVLSDDGSSDDTLDRVRAVGDRRIRIVSGPRAGSPTRNFEHALQQARGDVVFLADQDDVWHEDKVQVMLRALEQSHCVVSDCRVTDGQLRPVHPSFFAVLGMRPGRFYNLLARNAYIGCCMAFRREVLKKALPFPRHIPLHDIWLGNVAAFYYSLSFIPDTLIDFRRHDLTASTTAAPSQSSLWQKMVWRAEMIYHLIKIAFR